MPPFFIMGTFKKPLTVTAYQLTRRLPRLGELLFIQVFAYKGNDRNEK